MKHSGSLILGVLMYVLMSSVSSADVGYDRDQTDHYHQAMDSIWGNSFEEADYYAAIAFSPATGKYAWSYNYTTLAAAQRAALNECQERDATIVTWAKNGYCALALGEADTYGAAWANTQAKACSSALENCHKHSTKSRIVKLVSSRE